MDPRLPPGQIILATRSPSDPAWLKDREVVRLWKHLDGSRIAASERAKAEPTTTRTAREVVLTRADAINSERLRWLWSGRAPLRGLTVVAGEKGLGKSILTNAELVAKVTRGTLDGELVGTRADVLIVTAEDDWRSIVKPRLIAHRADLSRVHRVEVHDADGASLLTLPNDVAALEAKIVGLRDAGRTVAMVEVDPVGAFVPETANTHADARVRRILAPLAAMADRQDLAVIVVMHLSKDDSKRLIARVSGSGAFVNAARSVLGMVRDPDDPDGEQGTRRLILQTGTNWGRFTPTLAAHVESRLVDTDDGECADVGFLVIDCESSTTVDDVQRGPDNDGDDAEEAVAVALAKGPRGSLEVKTAVADKLGCSRKTVERAAMRLRDGGELTAEKIGFPATSTWTLAQLGQIPSPQSEHAPPSKSVPTEDLGATASITADSTTQKGQKRQGTTLGPTVPDADPPALFNGHPDPTGGHDFTTTPYRRARNEDDDRSDWRHR